MRTRKSARSGLVGLTAAALVTACLFGLTPAAEGQTQPTPVDAKTRVHWADGKALTTHRRDRLGASVKAYLSGRAVGRRAADTLRATGPAWSAGGVSHLRMAQYVDGLRVAGSDVKAAFDSRGRLVSLIENTVAATDPRAARISATDART